MIVKVQVLRDDGAVIMECNVNAQAYLRWQVPFGQGIVSEGGIYELVGLDITPITHGRHDWVDRIGDRILK